MEIIFEVDIRFRNSNDWRFRNAFCWLLRATASMTPPPSTGSIFRALRTVENSQFSPTPHRLNRNQRQKLKATEFLF